MDTIYSYTNNPFVCESVVVSASPKQKKNEAKKGKHDFWIPKIDGGNMVKCVLRVYAAGMTMQKRR